TILSCEAATRGIFMDWLWSVSYITLWVLVLSLGLLVLGLLRQFSLLTWRIEQIQATVPSRVGRDGLGLGTAAPSFSLKDIHGADVRLQDFANHKVLVVFTQPGCGPCNQVVPQLNALQRKEHVQVVVISNGEPNSSRGWAEEHGAHFPVLCQEHWQVSRRY